MAIEVRAYYGNVVETGTGNSGARAVLNVTNITTSGNGKQYSYECYLEVTKGDWYGTNFNINWAPWQSSNPHQISTGNRLYVGTFTTGIIAWGNTATLSCSAVYNKHGKVTTVSISETIEQPWLGAIDYAGTNGFSGWIKGPSIYRGILHFYVDEKYVGSTESNLYRTDLQSYCGFNFTEDLYSKLGKTGTFIYKIYALTRDDVNPQVFTGNVEIVQTVNPVNVTSISVGSDYLGWGSTYKVLSNSLGKVTGDSLSDLKYRIQINSGGYSEEFEQRVKFDGSYYALHELSSAGDNYLFETDSSMATDSILNYLQKGLLVFPVTVETSINAASKDIVNTYNYDIPTIVDFNKLYEEEVYRNIRRLDDGTTSVTFAIKYPKSYILSTVVPDKVTINDIDYVGTFTFENLGDNLLSFNTIISTDILGKEARGTFFAEFSDNISSVQVFFELPAMYDNDIVIGRKKVGILAVDVDYTSTSKTNIAINSFDDVATDSISLFNGYKGDIPRNTVSPFDKSYYKIGNDSAVVESVLESQRHTIKINGTKTVSVDFNVANVEPSSDEYGQYITILKPYQSDDLPTKYTVITNDYIEYDKNHPPIVIPEGTTKAELDTFFNNASFNYLPGNYEQSLDSNSKISSYDGSYAEVPDYSGNYQRIQIWEVHLLATNDGQTVFPIAKPVDSAKGDLNHGTVIETITLASSTYAVDLSITEARANVDIKIFESDVSDTPLHTIKANVFSIDAIPGISAAYEPGCMNLYQIVENTDNWGNIAIGSIISIGNMQYGSAIYQAIIRYQNTSFISSDYSKYTEDLEQYVAHLRTWYSNSYRDWDIICYPVDTKNTHNHWLYVPYTGNRALSDINISGYLYHTKDVIFNYNITSNDYYNNDLSDIKFLQVLDSSLETIKKGALIATSTSGITEVHYEFHEPSEQSNFIYCQCKEFIEGDEIGFAPSAKVLAKEFIEEPEDNNVYIGKNKTQFNELIEI